MNGSMEKIIRETLKDKPRPRLPADFASGVMERVDERAKRHKISRQAEVISTIYWIAAGLASTFILAGIRWPVWSFYLFLALTPLVFLAMIKIRVSFLAVSAERTSL